MPAGRCWEQGQPAEDEPELRLANAGRGFITPGAQTFTRFHQLHELLALQVVLVSNYTESLALCDKVGPSHFPSRLPAAQHPARRFTRRGCVTRQ